MNVTRTFNLITGGLVLISVLLTIYINFNFIYLAGFIGFMLFQAGITGFCPGRKILEAMSGKKEK